MFTLACSMLLPYSNASAETGAALNIEAGAAILVEANSGKIVYQKNADELLSIASMTKMMSEYLVHEAVDKGKLKWDQKIKVSEYAYKVSQDASLSKCGIRKWWLLYSKRVIRGNGNLLCKWCNDCISRSNCR